jgi:AraC-like DNA-binding protein
MVMTMPNVAKLKMSKPAFDQERLKNLCEWIDQNINRSIGWAELSAQSGMGHLELQREFGAQLQTSPMQWIRSRRRELEQTTLAEQFLIQKQLPGKLIQKIN